MKKAKIGFIGQGWIGKNYANDFEKRGYDVTRYGLESPFIENKEKISECDMVFIAVPTPTTSKGFDAGILRSVLPLVGKGKIAVIKSTVEVGLTILLHEEFNHCFIVHSPEFLSESTAEYDAANPERNIVGIPEETTEYKKIASVVMSVLAPAPYCLICSSSEAETIKYVHNVNGYIQVVFANMLYDFVKNNGVDWNTIKMSIEADPLMNSYYFNPIHKTGRGAGGHCFVKDFETFLKSYESSTKDISGAKILKAFREKNLQLLLSTNKDLDIVSGVYGSKILKYHRVQKEQGEEKTATLAYASNQ